jgi:hypothetical protein
VYDQEALARATKEMLQRVWASNQKEAKRVPGEVQCKFCRAHRNCVEYQKWAGEMTPPSMLTLLGVPMQAWTPEQCSRAAAALGPCDNFLVQLKDFLKEKLAKEPDSVPGWELKPGAVREKITNPQGVFERFSALGGKLEQFMPAVNVTKGALKTALNSLTGAKGKQLDAAMKTLTDGFVNAEQTAPSLKRKEDGK